MFCSIGALFARKGYAYFKTKKDKKSKCLTQTEGKIVSVSAMRVSGRNSAYFYTYEYEVNYEMISIKTHFGTTRRQFREGDRVKIWYDKSNPKYGYIDSYKEDTVAAVASLFAGILVVFIGIFVGLFVWFY